MKDVLNAFPDNVNPQKDSNWKFVENWGTKEGLKLTVNKFGYKEETYMKGAEPQKLTKFVSEIDKKINRKLPKGI